MFSQQQQQDEAMERGKAACVLFVHCVDGRAEARVRRSEQKTRR